MLLTVLCWGVNFVAVKYLYAFMSPPVLALGRAVPMALALVLICRWQGISLRYGSRSETLKILGLGALSMGIYMVFFLEGLRFVGAAEGAILMATSPLWTAVFAAWFGQERFRWGVALGGFVALVGVTMVVAGPQRVDPRGVALELVAAACWALSVVLSKPLMSNRKPLELLTLSMPGSFLILIPYGFMEAARTPWASFDFLTWGAFAHVSLLAGALGFFGFYRAVQDIGPVGAMLHQFLVPPTAMITGVLLLGAHPAPVQIAGLFVVLAGVWWGQRARLQNLTKEASPPP